MNMEGLLAALRRRGFVAERFETGAEAARYVLERIAPGERVGIGGSMTVKRLGLDTALAAKGARVFWHWNAAADERADVLAAAATADAYLCSANALTMDGRVVNIDGNANRVSALQYGVGRAYVIVGRNKLVDGGLDEAIARVKREACPRNARRLGLNTPCAITGRCVASGECFSPQKMCKTVSVLCGCPGGRETHVLIVEEELGY